MTRDDRTIFLSCQPGLEPLLLQEAREIGLSAPRKLPGGVEAEGGLAAAMRANLLSRGAMRVLLRLGSFPAAHLSQLDKRARGLPFGEFLPKGAKVRVEAVCQASKIYHSGAAAERVARAAAAAGAVPGDEGLLIAVRIKKDVCSVSLDTSGELLHRRGFKQAVGKAPLRETQAALFLRACGYQGEEPVFDPMCGSGTFPIEGAEIALGLLPGRGRRFAGQEFIGFDRDAFEAMKAAPARETPFLFGGSDRDAGAVAAATANAQRAGVGGVMAFRALPVSEAKPPEGPPGLVMVNPPYGGRIGDKRALRALYAALGRRLTAEFSGWRVGLVTSEPMLAEATGLPFVEESPPTPHGPLKIRLYRTAFQRMGTGAIASGPPDEGVRPAR